MINYEDFIAARSFYWRRGFDYIDTDWLVSEEAINITLPPDSKSYKVEENQHLVGSAEQGFLQLMLDGKLKDGRFCSMGPCFRSDPIDDLHQRSFFKLELISVNKNEVEEILSIAKEYFNIQLINYKKCEVVKTAEGFDLELNGIEIGSYGYRKYKDFSWTYGTGLAEPRFSLAKFAP